MQIMRRMLRRVAAVLSFLLIFNQFQFAANAQTSSSSSSQSVAPQHPGTPVPSQIDAAHKVFLTNAGADANFPIDSTESYNDLYAALQAWGHFQLVGSPALADLVLQLHDTAPITGVYGTDGNVGSVTSPAYQLTILDPKTNVPLWTITSPVYFSGKKSDRTHWVSISETNLVSRLKVLTGEPLSPVETADLTTYPKRHGAAVAWIAVGSLVAVGVGGGLLLHHEFENSLADQKASQDAFCNAHNIPLSECAGG